MTRRWFFWIAFAAGIGTGAFSSLLGILIAPPQQCPEVPKKEDLTNKIIAQAGEWVTAPEGYRVCKLRSDLVYGMRMDIEKCEDWQIPVPKNGEEVPFLRWSPAQGSQILVEHKWRP